MKRVVVILVTFLTLSMSFSMNAERYKWYNIEDLDFNSVFGDSGCVIFKLQEWGFFVNGQTTDPHDWSGKQQYWAYEIKPSIMYHLNTDDGDFSYDSKLNGNKIIYTKQWKWDGSEFHYIKNDNGFLRFIGFDPDKGAILTVDHLNVYRIFIEEAPDLIPDGVRTKLSACRYMRMYY